MTVCFFGIYDPNYSRNRVLMEGLRAHGYTIVECRADPRLHRGPSKYFELWRQYRRIRKQHFDLVLVAFPGQTVVWLARLLFGRGIIFDAFLSLYDSNVFDRKVHARLGLGLVDWLWDWSSCRLAGAVVLDTNQHIEYFVRTFGIPRGKFVRVWVGSDPTIFYPRAVPAQVDVHFHGMYIPLQGIRYIISAARLLEREGVTFRLVGKGQEYKAMRQVAQGLANVQFDESVGYHILPALIASSKVCLGIFGDTAKAGRVIPNKVYECMAMGKAVITADTPAIRELEVYGEVPLRLVPLGDPGALATAIRQLLSDEPERERLGRRAGEFFAAHCMPLKLVADLLHDLSTSALRA